MKRQTPEPSESSAVIIRHKDNGPLHDLLLKACPPNEKGEKSITILASRFDPPLAPWSVHKWVKKGKIPPNRAVQVVDMAEGRVTLANFSPFIYV